MKGDIEPSWEYIKITVCIQKKIKKNRVLYDSLSRGCTTDDWRRGFWCFCPRSSLWLAAFIPSHECCATIGCESLPAVLQRTRSLQLGSVGSCEPREKPCDPSQTRWVWIKLEPYSIEIANTLITAQTLDMATSILGVSLTLYLCAKVVRKVIVDYSLLQLKVLTAYINMLAFKFALMISNCVTNLLIII